jgi:VWFA-related protein
MRKSESKYPMDRKTCRQALLVIALLMASATYLWSQFRPGVEPVVVPVNVRDSDGRLVTGLTKDDFRVTEDGVPQTVSTFSIDPAPLSAAIVVDDGMGGEALKRLVPLLEVMTAGFAPEDEMIAFRYDHFIWKLSDFTSDQKVIQKSFNELAKIAETRPAQGEPGDAAAAAPGFLSAIAGRVTIGTNGAPNPIPTAADRPKPPPTSRILHDAVFEAANALKSRKESRRRIILLVSDGQATISGNKQSLEKNVDLLLQNNIQVYSVATDFALREGQLGLLAAYAGATGGDVYSGGSTSEMETAFSKITEQARNQYVLGYVSSNEPRGLQSVNRSIQVATRTPGQRVTHRKSYIQYPAR